MSKRLNDKNNSLIIASLIIGIIGLVFLYNPSISIGLGILTLIFGIFGIRKTKNKFILKENILAIIGILLGVIILFFGFNILYSLNFNYSNNSIDFKNIQQTQSQEKLTFITQNNQPQEYCGDGKCNSMETCSTCPTDCGQCKQPYNFKFYDNQEPYYSTYCDKINPYDLTVREAAAKAIRDDAGTYSINQLFDIYDWVKNNIVYQNVPLVGIPYPAKETIATESGDCKNQAVLIASMIEAIGGTAKVVADPSCTHAYSIVRFGSIGEDLSLFDKAVAKHYGINVQIEHFTNEDGI